MRTVFYMMGISVICMGGCASHSTTRPWGGEATLRPGWSQVGQTAIDVSREPETWVPLLGALALQIGGLDAEIADWAQRETPLWGSRGTAAKRSDQLLDASQAAYWLTVAFTPSGETAGDWMINKSKGICLGMTAVGVNHQITEFLKKATDRQRPDRSDDLSLPSGHASQASVYGSLGARNCRSLAIAPDARRGLGITCDALALGCAWSRVEAKKHYLSDVLAGFALGHFLAAFVNDAFIHGDGAPSPSIGLRLHERLLGLEVRWWLD